MTRFVLVALRSIPIFAIALIIGLWAAGIFADYRVRFYIEKDRSFSAEETEYLIGKKVLIHLPNKDVDTGTIVGAQSGMVEICCASIEREDNVKRLFGRESFNDFVTVIND